MILMVPGGLNLWS